jgi:hypothetical protein
MDANRTLPEALGELETMRWLKFVGECVKGSITALLFNGDRIADLYLGSHDAIKLKNGYLAKVPLNQTFFKLTAATRAAS